MAQDAQKATNAWTATDTGGMDPWRKTKKDAMCVDSKEQQEFHHTEVNFAVPQEAEMNLRTSETKLKIGLLKNYRWDQEESNQSFHQKKEDTDQSRRQGVGHKKEKKSCVAKDSIRGK